MPNVEPKPDLIGAAEAAEILNVNRRTVGKWEEKGRLRVALRLSGGTQPKFYDRHEVEALAAELRAGAASS